MLASSTPAEVIEEIRESARSIRPVKERKAKERRPRKEKRKRSFQQKVEESQASKESSIRNRLGHEIDRNAARLLEAFQMGSKDKARQIQKIKTLKASQQQELEARADMSIAVHSELLPREGRQSKPLTLGSRESKEASGDTKDMNDRIEKSLRVQESGEENFYSEDESEDASGTSEETDSEESEEEDFVEDPYAAEEEAAMSQALGVDFSKFLKKDEFEEK